MQILVTQSLIFMMQIPPHLSHGLITMDRFFLRSFNAVFSFNVRPLQIFQHGVLMEPNSCSKRVKKLIKVWLSEGGGIQFDLILKGGGFP